MHRPLATTHTGTAQDTPDAPGYPRIPSKKSAGNPMIPQHDSCSYRSFALPVARPPLPSTTPRRHTITVPRSPRFALPPSLRPTLCQRIHLSIDCWAPIRMHTHGRPPNTHTLSLSLPPFSRHHSIFLRSSTLIRLGHQTTPPCARRLHARGPS